IPDHYPSLPSRLHRGRAEWEDVACATNDEPASKRPLRSFASFYCLAVPPGAPAQADRTTTHPTRAPVHQGRSERAVGHLPVGFPTAAPTPTARSTGGFPTIHRSRPTHLHWSPTCSVHSPPAAAKPSPTSAISPLIRRAHLASQH